MKAVTQQRFGGPQVLHIDDVPRPQVGPQQVLVQVRAVPVTQGDRRLRAADYPGISAIFGRLLFGFRTPRNPIPGTMFAGRVVEVGAEVSRFSVGDDVFGSCDHSACAEFVAIDQNGPLAPMPANTSYAEAAAVPYGAQTALSFLRDTARVLPGERVLIIGAAGGVGRYAVQVARHLGATVTGLCSRRDLDLVRELGAHEAYDYRTHDYRSAGIRYDVIFDTSSGSGFRRARAALTETGRYTTLYMTVLGLLQMLGNRLRRQHALPGIVMGTAELTRDVGHLLADGVLRPVIAARFPMEQVVDAHRALEARAATGAVVLEVGAPTASPRDELAEARARKSA